MSPARQVDLAGSRAGRVVLHLVALWVDGRWGWHWDGIMREVAGR